MALQRREKKEMEASYQVHLKFRWKMEDDQEVD